MTKKEKGKENGNQVGEYQWGLGVERLEPGHNAGLKRRRRGISLRKKKKGVEKKRCRNKKRR